MRKGIKLSVWRIHRKIGMSGGLLTNMLLRETGLKIDSDRISSGCSGSTRKVGIGLSANIGTISGCA